MTLCLVETLQDLSLISCDRLQHAREELNKQQLGLKGTESIYKKEKAEFELASKARDKLQMEMARLNYREGQEEELSVRR